MRQAHYEIHHHHVDDRITVLDRILNGNQAGKTFDGLHRTKLYRREKLTLVTVIITPQGHRVDIILTHNP